MMNKGRQGAKDFDIAGNFFSCGNTGKKSNSELLDEIIEMMDCASEDEMDVESIEKKLTLLQEQAPVLMDHISMEFLESMTEKYPLLFEVSKNEESAKTCEPVEKKWTNHPQRFLHRFAGVSVAMLCLVIAAGAVGMKPVSSFLEWAEGVIFLYNHPSGTMEIPGNDIAEYHTLEEALSDNGMDSSYCPTWVPEDYVLSGVDVIKLDFMLHFTASYESERGELFVRIDSVTGQEWVTAEEYDGTGYEFEKDGILYYITSNANHIKAGWQVGAESYLISGQISENELVYIINSIKGGGV